MFTATKIRSGEGFLEKHLVANDYYNENESVSGEWLGGGARRLDIEHQSIDSGDKAFAAFRRNRLPDGSRMTPHDKERRVGFIGFQCSAPKSLSVLAVTAGDARLIEAHRESVRAAFAEMESFSAIQNNTPAERRNRLTGNLIAARFTHTASRALDPQVHDHVILVAATHAGEAEGWRALTEQEIFRAVRYLGKVYQNELARRCRNLGYELRPDYDKRHRVRGFEINGVAPETLKLFSKRRAQVEKAVEWFRQTHGREPSLAEVQVMVNQTRDAKLTETSTPEVIRRQRAQLDADALTALDDLKSGAMRRAREGAITHERVPGRESDALREAVSHLFERNCVARGHELMAEALNRDLGHLDLSALKRAVGCGPELVSVGGRSDDARHDRFVTPAGLRREQWMLHVAGESKGALPPLAQPEKFGATLSDEQRRAVSALLGCRDRFACLRGAAGVGKTTVLAEADRHLNAEGTPAIYCAPTVSAAETLRSDGLTGATTLAALLASASRNPPARGSVLVLDEAGLASHRDGAALMRVALENDCRVIFVGDTRQHAPVDAGDFLRLLETRAGIHRVELLEIRRQTEPAYRSAVAQMAAGNTREGLERLGSTGALREGGPEYLENAAKSFACAVVAGEDALCVTPTWEENHALTSAIRRRLKEAGRLGEGVTVRVDEPLSWTGAEKRDVSRYEPGLTVAFDSRSGVFRRGETAVVIAVDERGVLARTASGKTARVPLKRGGFEVCSSREIEISPGDALLLRANDRERGLANGARLTVESASAKEIRTAEGVTLRPEEFGRFAHGYVVTSHKSQGKTCDRVIVAAARLDAKAAYVACSRGRKSCEVHTPETRALLASLPEGDRPLAAEQPGFAQRAQAREISEKSSPAAFAWFAGPWTAFCKRLQAVRDTWTREHSRVAGDEPAAPSHK
jgi:conjugative relaxase-like TrwC/TraI family protein